MRVPVKEADRDLRHGNYPYYGSVGVIDHIDDFIFEGKYLLISEDGKHLESRTRPIACIASGKFWVNNHAHIVKFNGKSDLMFLAHFMEMIPIRKYITGIDQIKLNRKSLDRIPVPIPPIELQTKFREIVDQILNQKSRMNGAVNNVDNLFNGLSQQAFSGELTKQAKAA
jgi:type I restriction enzyme, S subunit